MAPVSHQPASSRALFDHHMLISAFGGVVLGAVACVVLRAPNAPDAPTLLVGWSLLGALHGQFLWPILQRKAWWTTAAVQYAALGGMFVACLADAQGKTAFLIPLAALWAGAVICWRGVRPVADPGTCRICGYDLRYLTRPRCPECGTAFDPIKAPTVPRSESPA